MTFYNSITVILVVFQEEMEINKCVQSAMVHWKYRFYFFILLKNDYFLVKNDNQQNYFRNKITTFVEAEKRLGNSILNLPFYCS